MNISLTPELAKFVEKEVESGLYQTASEVVREGLRLLKDRDARELRADVRAGFEAADRGEYSEHTPASIRTLAAQVKAGGRQRMGRTKKTRTK